MFKFLLYLLIPCLTIACINTSAQSKLSPDLRMKLAQRGHNKSATAAENPQFVSVMIRADKALIHSVADQLPAKGAKVYSIISRHIVASIPLDSVLSIEAIDGVKRIALPRGAKFRTANTRKLSHVDEVLDAAEPLSRAYTGKGVTVGMIDCGFDFQHPAFADAEGNSRIKAVYIPGSTDGTTPTITDPDEGGSESLPGSAFTSTEAIATLKTDYTAESHGSHTTCIAAGSHWNNIGGMAPEADIVICAITDEGEGAKAFNDEGLTLPEEEKETIETEDQILYSLTYLADYAAKSGKPTVVNMSLGTHLGPHNGKGDMADFISSCIENGLTIVMSSGNEGNEKIHVHKALSADDNTLKCFIKDNHGDLFAEVNAFSRTAADLSASLAVVNLESGAHVYDFPVVNSTTKSEEESTVFVSIDDEDEAAKFITGDINYGIYADPDLQQTELYIQTEGELADGYGLALLIFGNQDTEVDAWEENYCGFTNYNLDGFTDGDSEITLSDWASVPDIISVGSYTGTNVDYDTYFSSDETDVIGEIADYSSRGTALNGVKVPTICAPGDYVISAINRYDTETIDLEMTPLDGMYHDGAFYGTMCGTSMSSPCVAGIVALLLEAAPSLSPADIKSTLVATATHDEFTAANPVAFGGGKVNAFSAILSVLPTEATRISNTKTDVSSDAPVFDLTGRQVRQMRKGGFYISDGKKIIGKF